MKIKIYYYWQHASYMDKGKIDVWATELNLEVFDDRVLIKAEEVDIPDCEEPAQEFINAQLTATLKAEKAAILAETHRKLAVIDEKINQLAAITFNQEQA